MTFSNFFNFYPDTVVSKSVAVTVPTWHEHVIFQGGRNTVAILGCCAVSEVLAASLKYRVVLVI
jgi:hypothetical protein